MTIYNGNELYRDLGERERELLAAQLRVWELKARIAQDELEDVYDAYGEAAVMHLSTVNDERMIAAGHAWRLEREWADELHDLVGEVQ